jgi:hypothetical protein
MSLMPRIIVYSKVTRPPACLVKLRKRIHEFGQRVALLERDQLGSELLHRGVQRDREPELLGALRELEDPRNDPHRRHRDLRRAPSPNPWFRIVRVGCRAFRLASGSPIPMKTTFEIGPYSCSSAQRAAPPELGRDLAGGELPAEPAPPGRAEGASHRAPGLRRDAEREPVRGGDQHRLDELSVARGFQRCFAVPSADRDTVSASGNSSRKAAASASRSVGRQVGHAIKRLDPRLVHPSTHLPRPVPGLTARPEMPGERLVHGVGFQREEVGKGFRGVHRGRVRGLPGGNAEGSVSIGRGAVA